MVTKKTAIFKPSELKDGDVVDFTTKIIIDGRLNFVEHEYDNMVVSFRKGSIVFKKELPYKFRFKILDVNKKDSIFPLIISSVFRHEKQN